jgi:hypothetical protein
MQSWAVRSCGFAGFGRLLKYAAERFGQAAEARLRLLQPHRPQRASFSLHIEVLMERRKRQVARLLLKPLRKMPADLPDGLSGQFRVQPHLQKYFASPVGQIISTNSRHPTPPEGRIAIVTDAGLDAVDAAAFCARGDGRAGSLNP